MKLRILLPTLIFLNVQVLLSQIYPSFGNEIPVTVNGLNFDAMEPFISLDGNIIYFNSLNSADTTNLYYAARVNDSTFNYVGLVGGTLDTSAANLDAVPSIDSLSNFYWTSLRDYPGIPETIHRGTYSNSSVSNINKVYGDFNILAPGWLVFDAAINFQGTALFYSNAYFNNCAFGAPCTAFLGVAEKVNDSTFNKLANSDVLFSNINDTSYIIYAPQVTKDGLEIYFTRLLKNTSNTEICVSVRNSLFDIFSSPIVIHSNLGFTPEAATPTSDKQKIYYHQRDATGTFKLFMRCRENTADLFETMISSEFSIYPNPVEGIFKLNLPNPNQEFKVEIQTLAGSIILSEMNQTQLDISQFAQGMYLIRVTQKGSIWSTKIQKK